MGSSTHDCDAGKEEQASLARQAHADGRPADTSIALGEDGIYGWHAEIDLKKNPTIALIIAKMMAFIGLVLVAIVVFGLFREPSEFGLRRLLWVASIAGGVYLFALALSAVAYVAYAHSLGWRYAANYLMDETGVIFSPAPHEGEVARNVALGTAVLAAMIGRYELTAAGIAAVDNNAASRFGSVWHVKGIRRHCVIKVSQPFLYNQVYVSPRDYDFVYGYISERCPRAWRHEA